MKNKGFLIMLVIFSLFIFVSCQGAEPTVEEDSNVEMNEEVTDMEENEEEATNMEDNEEETTDMQDNEEEATEEMLELTLEELSEYNGKDGSRAYVAVEGIIYDVTDLGAWKNGMHNGVSAGKDLTDEIMNQSPHGTSTLSKAEKVGKLIE
jgi:predicted heme/steroid binding protein